YGFDPPLTRKTDFAFALTEHSGNVLRDGFLDSVILRAWMPNDRYSERSNIVFWLALAATAAILVSIAAWQILLGVALGWLLWTTRRLKFPRSMLAAAAFL